MVAGEPFATEQPPTAPRNAFVNGTALEQQLSRVDFVEALFNRWYFVATLRNPERTDRTGGFVVMGDSRKERDIGVANGFTSQVFGKWEAFISSPVM